jgi:L-fucose dehydrogenase
LGLTREWAVDLIQYGIRSNAIIIAESFTPAYDDWLKTLPDGVEVLKKINKSIPFEGRMTKTEEIADTALYK